MTDKRRLPVELYREIISNPSTITKHDLLNLCLASKALSSEAYRLLYRRIDLKDPVTLQLALQSLNETAGLPNLVITLALILPLRSFSGTEWIKSAKNFTLAVNKMKNLRELHISKTWDFTSDSFIHSRVGHLAPGCLWSDELRISQIQTLSLDLSPGGPISHLFEELPPILQTLVVQRNRYMSDIRGVIRLRSVGNLLWDQPIMPAFQDLRILEMYDLKNFKPNQVGWAPNLHTFAYLGDVDASRRYSCDEWLRVLSFSPSLKKIGPICCKTFPEPVISALSQMEQLEVVILVVLVATDAWQDPAQRIEQWFQDSTKLQQVAILVDHQGDIQLYTWEKRREEGPQNSDERLLRRGVQDLHIEEWSRTVSSLLGLPFIEFIHDLYPW